MYANANVVSRTLTKAHIRKAVKQTGRVRGYHNWTEGVLVTTGAFDLVKVEYRFNNFDKRDHADQVAHTVLVAGKVVAALTEAGYTTEIRLDPASGFASVNVKKAGA